MARIQNWVEIVRNLEDVRKLYREATKMKKIIFFLMTMTIISVNSFSGILGGGSGASDYWQMKTYFEKCGKSMHRH